MRPSLMSTTMTRQDSVPKSKPRDYFAIAAQDSTVLLRLAAAHVQEVAHQPRVADVWLARGKLLIRVRLVQTLDYEAAVDDQVHPAAERAMKARHTKFRDALARLGRRCAENPFLNLAIRRIEIPGNLHVQLHSLLIPHRLAIRRRETGMADGELEEPAGLEHAKDLGKGGVLPRHIHQTHRRHREIKRAISERQPLRAGEVITNAARLRLLCLHRVPNERWRNI